MNSILFVLNPSYFPSGQSGGAVLIVNSLMAAFLSRNWSVGFVGLVKPRIWREGAHQPDPRIRSWIAVRAGNAEDEKVVADAIAEMDPDIIYCYGPEPTRMARRAAPRGKVIAMFAGAPNLAKRIAELRYGDLWTKANALRRMPITLKRMAHERREVSLNYASADLIVSHAYDAGIGYAPGVAARFTYRPLPLGMVDPVDRQQLHSPPTFLLTGALNSTESQAGLRFFTRRVLPHLQTGLRQGELLVRVIGRGELPADLARALRGPGLELLGYVSDARLLDEYQGCTALLVPSPLGRQSPTRVLDAFRRGIPVIAHRANSGALKELADRHNCLLASTGASFATAMREAVGNPPLMQAVARRAREEFETQYCADQFCAFLITAAGASNENGHRQYDH